MALALPLDKMTPAEKLEAIEILWADLYAHEEAMPVPEWHRELLNARESSLAIGEQIPIPWSAAKEELDRRLRCK